MLDTPRSFEVQCGSILIVRHYPPAIVLELGENSVESSPVGFEEGEELIYFGGGGTVVVSCVDRIQERWSKERVAQASIAGINFFTRKLSSSEQTRLGLIQRALARLEIDYLKPPVTLR